MTKINRTIVIRLTAPGARYCILRARNDIKSHNFKMTLYEILKLCFGQLD